MSNIRWMLFAATVLLLSACGTSGKGGGMFQAGLAEQKLASGVKSYEEGDYKSSMDALLEAEKMGLSHKADKVTAHKYKAFIYCITDRTNKCRHEFEDIFEVDPNFDLKPAEAGHPVWGPVFRNVKAGFTK